MTPPEGFVLGMMRGREGSGRPFNAEVDEVGFDDSARVATGLAVWNSLDEFVEGSATQLADPAVHGRWARVVRPDEGRELPVVALAQLFQIPGPEPHVVSGSR